MTEEITKINSLILRSAADGKLCKAILSKPHDKAVQKAVLRPISTAKGTLIQLESFTTDNKAYHKNLTVNDTDTLCEVLCGFSQINVFTTAGECQYSVSKKGKVLMAGVDKVLRALDGASAVEYEKNNREKNRILVGNEAFLVRLGVSDENGRVFDKKQSKFRQINRFLEYVRDCVPYLKRDGQLRVLDLCCGKSYLSFALYYYLTSVLGRDVRMTGIDLKDDVIAECSKIASDLGFTGLEFIAGDIRKCEETSCDMVVSLHACDIATDIVLSTACRCRADVILSTPCCHHYLAHTIDCEPLSFITAYPILGGKLCDAATDALRLAFLAKNGYDVAAFELIDPNETPKNVLLRGIRKKGFDKTSDEARALCENYARIERFLLGDKKYEELSY
jgi:SAM-dependent methyltransferase